MSKLPTNESRASKSGGLLQEIHVSTLKLEDINMDFVVGLPRTQKQYDFIWVIVDRLTKSAHFIPVKATYSLEDYARIFIYEIMCCRGIRYLSYRIEVQNSHLGFRGHSNKGWVPR